MTSPKPIRSSRVPASRRPARLRLEALEERALLTLAISGNANTDSASLVAASGPGAGGTIGFDNVGESSTHNASVTYLGNGWCLTANHVTIDNNVGLVRFAGQSYTVDMSTITQLKNTDNKPTDLKVFRLSTDPGLPSELGLPWVLPSQIVSSTPAGRQIMIGNGLSIGDLHFWHVDTSETPPVWSEQSPPLVPGPDDYKGYDITGVRDIRWGENDFEQTLTVDNGQVKTIGYLTRLDDTLYTLQTPRDSEGQASSGDSGGAVYAEEGSQWKLGGIMDAVTAPRSGQPANTTIFGDRTFIVDLSQYRNQILAAAGSVASRQLFYKGSTKWNVTNNNLPGFSDDNAIAPDKTAYLPGSGTSPFSSVSSYTKGINGLMVDLYSQHGTITANDFIFKVGNNNSPSTWATATGPTTVTTRAGAGVEGTDRVELMWADGAITGTWLQVIVKGNDALGGSNTNTGLRASDVFYFGSAPGDAGAADAAAFAVTSADEISARNDPHGIGDPATISNVNDFDRNGLVGSADEIIARNDITTLANQLKFLNIGAGGPFAPDSSPVASSTSTAASSSEAGGTQADGDMGLSTALVISMAPAAGFSAPSAAVSTLSPAASVHSANCPVGEYLQLLEQQSRSSEVRWAGVGESAERWMPDDELLDALAYPLDL